MAGRGHGVGLGVGGGHGGWWPRTAVIVMVPLAAAPAIRDGAPGGQERAQSSRSSRSGSSTMPASTAKRWTARRGARYARPAGVAVDGEGEHRPAVRRGDRGPLGAGAGELGDAHGIEVVERERDVHGVAGAEHPAERRRRPVERVHPRRRLGVQVEASLDQLLRRGAERRVGVQGDDELLGRRTGPGGAVGGQHRRCPLAELALEDLERDRLVDVGQPGIERQEQGHLVVGRADHQRQGVLGGELDDRAVEQVAVDRRGERREAAVEHRGLGVEHALQRGVGEHVERGRLGGSAQEVLERLLRPGGAAQLGERRAHREPRANSPPRRRRAHRARRPTSRRRTRRTPSPGTRRRRTSRSGRGPTAARRSGRAARSSSCRRSRVHRGGSWSRRSGPPPCCIYWLSCVLL